MRTIDSYTELAREPVMHLRIEGAEPKQVLDGEEAKAVVGPPFDIRKAIELWSSSPWLAAVGKLIRDALVAAQVEVKPTPGVPDPDEGQKRVVEEWISRPEIAIDGTTELSINEFIAAAWLYADQTGNVFAEVLRSTGDGKPAALALIPPQQAMFHWEQERAGGLLEPAPDRPAAARGRWILEQTAVSGYARFVPFGRRGENEGLHEYLQFRRPNLLSGLWGVPDWIEASHSVEVDIEHRKYLLRFFASDSAPRRILWVTPSPEWIANGGTVPNPEIVEDAYKLIQSFMAANQGVASGKTLLVKLPGGVTIGELPLSAKANDPTYQDAAKLARDEILAIRRVSLIDLGLPEGGYRATAAEQSRNFRENVLRAGSRVGIELLNRLLRAPEPVGLGVTDWRVTANFERGEDLLARIEAVFKAVGVPFLDPDEGRQLIGYPERGDKSLYRPATMVAYDEAAEE